VGVCLDVEWDLCYPLVGSEGIRDNSAELNISIEVSREVWGKEVGPQDSHGEVTS
jgi:hypothetical protein